MCLKYHSEVHWRCRAYKWEVAMKRSEYNGIQENKVIVGKERKECGKEI